MLNEIITCLREERVYRLQLAQWKTARRISIRGRGKRALIVPCDPWAVVGSRGDQAMIMAVIQHLRAENASIEVDALTDSHETDDSVRALGINPRAEWSVAFDQWMGAHAADYNEVIIVGADVTDGVYGFSTAMKMLMFYDVFSWLGARTRYLGFSWSRTPHRMLRRILRRLRPGLPLPVRDPVSYRRVESFTSHRPLVQVADVAFCLKPSETDRVRSHRRWVDAQHQAGKCVIGLNVHTMFNEAVTKSSEWERAFVDVLKTVQDKCPEVSWLLIPHDNRPQVSDHAILKRLYGRFDSGAAYLVDEVMRADEIKSLIGSCDGLIAGRMHISIAALGMGVPVFGLVYQGKFEGLWQLFDLSDEMFIEPHLFIDEPLFVGERLIRFIVSLGTYAVRVDDGLQRVLKLARMNFEEGI